MANKRRDAIEHRVLREVCNWLAVLKEVGSVIVEGVCNDAIICRLFE